MLLWDCFWSERISNCHMIIGDSAHSEVLIDWKSNSIYNLNIVIVASVETYCIVLGLDTVLEQRFLSFSPYIKAQPIPQFSLRQTLPYDSCFSEARNALRDNSLNAEKSFKIWIQDASHSLEILADPHTSAACILRSRDVKLMSGRHWKFRRQESDKSPIGWLQVELCVCVSVFLWSTGRAGGG